MPTIDDELTRMGVALRKAADDRDSDGDAVLLRPSDPSQNQSRVVWAVAATVATLLALGTPVLLGTLSNPPAATAASTTPPVAPTTSTLPTEATPEQSHWYALDASGWTLVGVDTDRGNDSVLLHYTSEREGARHPDRVFLIVSPDGEPSQDLDVLVAGGSETEGRVDGFGNPWETPVDQVVSVGERQVRVVSFTNYQHIALWTDEGVGLELHTDRATFDQLLDLIGRVVGLTAEEWEAVTSQ